ncbi:MarR family transcriptional regulator [Enterococcus raffinosus]|uniref:MarR family winged helix-turn-helix transcriptional regulator n=1 Tax=Enterococcus raffinosus TaxID=71452 RepID=UPI001C127A36|nr:helix-turn-helix domain-containing protein [Enterococcus raffinosus]MBU5361928.1 MarR family transcriptional regulator [Enterococcus raffinosus]
MENDDRLFLISQTYATLFSVTNKLQAAGDESMRELTTRQLMALIAIAHIPKEEVTLNAIASKLGATKQSTAQIINNLKNKEYLTSEKSKSDARAVNIIITKKGKKIFEEANKQGWMFLQNTFKAFSEEELTQLWTLLKKLYQFDGEVQDGFEADGRKL